MRPWLKLIFVFGIIYIYGRIENHHLNEYVIPFNIGISQPDHITCGPVCAMMLIHHYGNKQVTLNEIKYHTKTVWFKYDGTDFGMTSPNYISVALEKFGIDNRIRRGNLDVLKHYICLNKPCIILMRTSEVTWHYVVAVGFTEEKILIYDTNATSYYMNTDKFVGAWSWQSSLDEEVCKNNDCCILLKTLGIYPYTFILPD